MPSIIFKQNNHHIEINDADRKIFLFEGDHCILQADFKFDRTDSAAVLSNIRFLIAQDARYVFLLLEMTNAFLLTTPNNCKLFCFIDESLNHTLNGTETFRSTNIDRFMLREKPIYPKNPLALLEGITISKLKPSHTTEDDKHAILNLLHQTYWAHDAKLDYINLALDNSTLIVARDESNTIIGLVRYISNNHIAYLSDMAVDEHHRRKNIATALLTHTLEIIDNTHEFSALISAREGDGKAASEKLYTTKFGFIDYNKQHEHTVQFAYVNKNAKPTASVIPHSIFNNTIQPVQPASPMEKQPFNRK